MIPLKEAAKRNRPRASEIRIREIVPTKSQADDLAAIYLEVMRYWRDVGQRIVTFYDPPALTTDTIPEIESELVRSQVGANALILALTPRVRRWTELFAAWHSRKWASNVQAATGVSIAAFLAAAPVADDLATALAWNVGLIRNVSDQARDRIANIVWSGWRARIPRNEIAKQINQAIGLGRDRSRRIAVDQATKLSAELDRSRMLEAGIDEWIWRHSGKAHPRLDHVARNGNRYTWQNAPEDIPGELPFCGCKAQAVLDL
jgi:SPP1 gp7 family putative phage head morphogenesis protein